MRINPALLKLELFCNGIRIDKSCRLDSVRPILRTRGGLGSGLEMVLPRGMCVNVPVEEHFVSRSPFTLTEEDGKHFIRCNGMLVCPVFIPRRPRFYDRMTSSGKPMSRIGVMQGTYLGIYPSRVCEFWKTDPRMNCGFCSVGLNVGVTEEPEKSVRDVLETVIAAREEERITFVHFNTGYLNGEELDVLEPYIIAVKKRTGLLIGVQSPPAPDLGGYNRLKKIGVDHVSFCIELIDPARFTEVCPGKQRYLGQQRYLEAMAHCVRVFGRGRVSGEVIAGLESPQFTIKAIEMFAKMGVVSTVCVFRPCRGTVLEGLEPPRAAELVPVFRRAFEVCLENNILIGMAPNIKVSLVLLAEEARYLAGMKLRYLPAMLRMRLLRFLVKALFNLRLAAGGTRGLISLKSAAERL